MNLAVKIVQQFSQKGIVLAKFSLEGNETTLTADDYVWLRRLVETNPLIMFGKEILFAV